ncbi:metal-dependent hydrolase [Lentibacillus cibarius]|nr:metal-dependent hydrolase [Lentibacillus cibarius]
MEWRTHLLSGLAAGYVVTGDWRAAVVGGIAAVISDLDEPKSKFGKMVFPLSLLINKMFGHRTATHSLLFVVAVVLVLYPFTREWVWLSAGFGVIAHIIGDMLTGKVQCFYPAPKEIGLNVTQRTFFLIDRCTALLLLVYLGKEMITTI